MSIWRGSIIALVLALAAGVAAAQSSELGKITPAPASARFPANFPPADFSPLLDAQWGFPIGGFGGTCRNPLGQPVSCLTGQPATKCDRSLRPVIFVHGNTRDASDWADDVTMCGSVLASGGGVHAEFLRRGYCDDQLWSISYNGAATALCTSGAPTSPHAANEINVPDVYRFIGAVMEYTGSSTVDIVAHSLGVTIVRRMFFEFPGIKSRVGKFVAIDGANHGTSLCRDEEHLYYGCDEIGPGSYWLNQINGCGSTLPATPPEAAELNICHGSLESFGITTLVIHNDDGQGEDFFFLPPDQLSPLLYDASGKTLTTIDFPGLSHDQLRFQTACNYLNFLLGQHASCPIAPRQE